MMRKQMSNYPRRYFLGYSPFEMSIYDLVRKTNDIS